MTVCVEAAARLHFGVLDLRGTAERWFGGIGAAAPGPTLLVRASLPAGPDLPAEAGSHRDLLPAEAGSHRDLLPAEAGSHRDLLPAEAGSHRDLLPTEARSHRSLLPPEGGSHGNAAEAGRHEDSGGFRLQAEGLVVTGEDADRAREFARRFLAHYRLPCAARIHVARALPAHAGLGSGTQLALSVARALAELHGIVADAPALARAVGRGRRSAVGTWTFAGGGLVVEGGKRRDDDACAPLLARIPFPPGWRCIVAIPSGAPAMTGAAEDAAFATLPVPPDAEVHRVADLVRAQLMPAVAGDDIGTFGAALTEIQEITGRWWAPIQAGTYADASGRVIEVMRRAGAVGAGQSSWGPTVYGIVATRDDAARLVNRLRDELGADGAVYEGAFRNEGARIAHESGTV